jgi:hypothetical protein
MIGFELTPEVKAAGFHGASFAYGQNKRHFNIGEYLDAGNGVIATDDPLLTASLRGVPYLCVCDVPEGTPVVDMDRLGGSSVQKQVAASYTPQVTSIAQHEGLYEVSPGVYQARLPAAAVLSTATDTSQARPVLASVVTSADNKSSSDTSDSASS